MACFFLFCLLFWDLYKAPNKVLHVYPNILQLGSLNKVDYSLLKEQTSLQQGLKIVFPSSASFPWQALGFIW